MSAPRPAMQVFRKEALEMMRDKRVRTGAFIMPIFVILLMVSLFGVIASAVGKTSRLKIHVVATKDPLVQLLKSNPTIDVKTVATVAEGEKLIKDGKARIVAEINRLADGRSEVVVHLDPKEDAASIARRRLEASLKPEYDRRQDVVLRSVGLHREQIDPIPMTDKPVMVGEGAGASGIIVSFLPYMLVLFSFTGGFSIASDLVAGEKEKSTLGTLLIAPVQRSEIVFGKWMSLALVCFLSSMSAMLGLIIASVAKLPGSEIMFASGFSVSPTSALGIFAVLIPLIGLFAGVLLAVTTYARNTREAQTYLGLVNLVVLIPAIFSQIIGLTDFGSKWWINLVPILNAANNIRSALLGKIDWTGILITDAVCGVLAAIGLITALRLFSREEVLIRV